MSSFVFDPENQSIKIEGGVDDGARRSALSKELVTRIIDDVRTPYEGFLRTAKSSGDLPCLGTRGGPENKYQWITYGEVNKRATNLGSGLVHLGCQPSQDTFVGIYAPNCVEWDLADLACQMHSMISVPIYDTHGAEGCIYIINHADIETIICNGIKLRFLFDNAKECEKIKRIVKIDGPVTEEEKKEADSLGIALLNILEVEQMGSNSPHQKTPGKPEDIITICYTSGTTGTPKGAMITNSNMNSEVAALQMQYEAAGIQVNRNDCIISYLPLAHMYERLAQLKDVPFLEEGTKTVDTLATLMLTGCTTHQIAEIIMQCQPLRNAIKFSFLKDVNEQCQKLCNRSAENSSLLRIPPSKHKELKNFTWEKVITEMKECVPDVLDVLAAVGIPNVKAHEDSEKQIAPLCTAYGILMFTRWKELSLIQKMNSILLSTGHATERTMKRLNRAGVTVTRETYRSIMDDIGSDLIVTIRRHVSAGCAPRLFFDNLDFKILVNIILQNHRHSDMHWIAHYVTFDRVPSDHLDDNKPMSDSTQFENIEYLLSQSELDKLRSDFIVLVARILVEFFEFMEPYKSAIPKHIQHRYSEFMKKKSVIIGLPVVPYNQSKHSDVCQYLEYVQKLLVDIYKPQNQDMPVNADEVLKNVKVPLGGDLLGRERITGAKKTRLGCDSAAERFESIVETPALWHAKQSFLGYIWEQLYKPTPASGRKDTGTLYHLRQHFGLVNVPSRVLDNYSSCESLMLSATKAYICSAFMAWAGTSDTATSPSWVSSIGDERNSAVQWESLQIQIGKFVDEYVLTEFDIERAWQEQLEQNLQEKENQRTLRLAGNDDETNAISSPAQQPCPTGSVVILLQKSEDYKVLAVGKAIEVDAHRSVPEKHVPVFVASIEECASGILTPGSVVFWPTDLIAVYKSPEISQTSNRNLNSNISDIPPGSEEDCYLNYGLQVIQLGMFLMQLNDTEAEGDGERSLINWKMLLLYFRSRPRGKKYAFEAMRFITCIKGLYTEKIAHRVLHGQFVNPKGGEGSNYANDLKMEHLVGDNKVSLRGLCGNKTLKAVQRCSAAAYGLKECCTQYDNECGIHPESTKHTHACTTEDVKAMLAIVQQAKPFQYQRGRTLHSFPNVSKSPLDQLDVALLNTWLTNHKRKLFSGIHDCHEEDHEENELSNDDENTPEEEELDD